ncbi:hypothetical protein CPLU01_15511 [Colletotrichum plurivorum]|uniref:Uncharacterized protein n=1 Tax=Colletotrichum plurivorum TaxID=2175906 RepID=A0A8H6JB94_9PEZI|nr:hypothetical protein CPLU01_15511 [Colletotrichum plurivorum]
MATHSDASLADANGASAMPSRHSTESEISNVTIGPDEQHPDIPAEEAHTPVNEAEKAHTPYQSSGKLSVLAQWKFEFLALLASILAFVSMAILLKMYHGKQQPQFAYATSINTLVAAFTTLLRAPLLFTVAGVVGQTKWSWMAKPRPLRHVERFDDAGKGLSGSLRLFLVTRKPSLIVLGATVVIASYAIGPFAQQAVKTYSYAIFYDYFGLREDLQRVALNGLVTEPPRGAFDLFHCDSANCTFPFRGEGATHTTAGICSRCIDVRSELLEFSEDLPERSRSQIYGYRFHDDSDFHLIPGWGFNMTTTEHQIYDLQPTEIRLMPWRRVPF